MSEGLLRQRRNLILISALLWIMKFGGVSFRKFTLAGFDVEFANPQAVTLCLWIAFAYFFYRYYQYFVAEGLTKLEGEFINSVDKYTEKTIARFVHQRVPDWSEGTRHGFSALASKKWVFKAERHLRDADGVARRSEPFEIRIPPSHLVGTAVLGVLDATFRSTVVTDYVLPFLLGCFVLWYCGSADWPGSFLSMLFAEAP